ncbi:hybrid sensor histidine kinase/response regulator [Desulfofustis limnaeus]|uniref:hybrid sensor histidine kinase/response regulator n=1 Tax=Desulfofustis limnaeus TaxID=2740163 RepID=UPI0024DF4E40|nr:PAS domain-containing sensor histidine kinase [Desulfofustis limnaeus]
MALVKARVRYFDLYDVAPIGYCTLNAKGLITEANKTIASLLGVAQAELIERPLSHFILKQDQDIYYLFSKPFFKSVAAVQRGQGRTRGDPYSESSTCELRMVKKDQAAFWVSLKMSAVHWAEQQFEFRVTLSDISDRKRAEERQVDLDVQQKQIQKAESLQRMAGAIAHLFNNQLYVVMGNLEMALDDLVGSPTVRSKLVNAIRAARRSSEVSGLMLTYLGHNAGEAESIDLSAMCLDSLSRIQRYIPDHVAIETDLSFPGPVVKANTSQLQQVLIQLITNGWEAIGDRIGRIRITTKTINASEIPKSHIAPAEWRCVAEIFACLEISDTGCGISGEEMDKIFDPFFSTKFTGRGLGLAVATGLAKAWNGMIGVESTVGKGSVFRFCLPLVNDGEPLLAEQLPEPWDFKKTAKTVLVVDDDYIVRTLTVAVLERLGLSVHAAAGGKEAIALFQRHQGKIDCLITDLCMPDMDGWETLSAVRKIQADLPVILSSGYDEAKAMSGYHSEHIQAFLHKPYSLDDVREVLGRILGLQNSVSPVPVT